MSFGAAPAFVAPRGGGGGARSTRWTRRCGGATRRASTWWCGPEGSATSSRAAPSTPSTSGSSSRSWIRTGRRSSTPAPRTQDGRQGPVEPGAHFYRSLQLDEHGNAINKRNAWATRSVAYVRLIPPGAADTVHYRLRIPEDCGERITVKARLNYRKFAWWNTQWAFAGVRDPEHRGFSIGPGHDDGRWVFTGDTSGVSGKIKDIPDIPITVMDEKEARIRVLPKDAPRAQDAALPRRVRPRAVERLRDRAAAPGRPEGRGGGLPEGHEDGALLRGRVGERRPRAAHRRATSPGPRRPCARALEADPGLAKTHFFLGTALKQSGRYDEALPHLRRAASLYPRDRVVRNQIGRLLFLKRQYREAIAELEAGARHRSGGPAGALQSDAQLPGSRRQRDGEESTRRSTGASRRTSRPRRSPGPTASCTPTTTTSARRCTSTPRPSGTTRDTRRRCPPAPRRLRRPGHRSQRRQPQRPRPASRTGAGDEAEAPARARAGARPRPGRHLGPVRRRDPVRERHLPRRDRLPPQLRRLRQEVPAGDHGLGPRPLRLRQRRLARRLLRERDAVAGPGRVRRPSPRSTATTGTARSPT